MPTILAFTSPQVQRLTGLSERMLMYWEKTDVYRPAFVGDLPHRPYRRIYSFSDVVSLRTLATLRRTHKVQFEELRKTGHYLSDFYEKPWTQRFWVQGGRVLFQHPQSHDVMDRTGQTTYVVDVEKIKREVEAETEGWNQRSPEDIGLIVRHRHVQHNQWVIKGTRIPTSAVWSFHVAGYDCAQIIREYPTLTEQDVDAALEHEQRLNAA